MRFDQKIMNYVMGSITTKRLENCRTCIEEQAERFGGGFTALQAITLKSMLKTLRKRIVTSEEFNEPKKQVLLDRFDFLFKDIMSFSIAR